MKSSCVYQVFLYFNSWYFGAFAIVEVLLFIYKSMSLPYHSQSMEAEIVLLFFLTIVEAARNAVAQKGNLTEHAIGIILSILLTIPSLCGILYFLLWQTYVLKIEVIMIAIQMAFYIFETLMGIFCIIAFSRE